MGMYFDIDFSGTIAEGSTITITLPYDQAIPDARARNLKLKHWVDGAWETVTPDAVDTVAHTVTFTVNSLSPFAHAELSSVDTSTTLVAGFGSATGTKSELIVGYGKSATLVGKLSDAQGTGLPNKTVIVERWDAALSAWFKVADAAPSTIAGEFRLTVKPASKTMYRMRFIADAYNAGAESASRTVFPKAYVSTPKAPKTMARGKYYTIWGSLKPRHASGTYPVRIYKWRKTAAGKWKSYGSVKVKVSNYYSFSKYSKKMRFTERGTWRVRAYAPKDSRHAAAWSSGYDYIVVK